MGNENKEYNGFRNGFCDYIESSQYGANIAASLFEGESDLVIDASVIYGLDHYIKNSGFELGNIDATKVRRAIGFTESFTSQLEKHKERVYLFPELREEWHGRVLKIKYRVTDMLKKAEKRKSQEKSALHPVKELLEQYVEKTNALDELSEKYQSKARFDETSDELVDFLDYLNRQFNWKDVSTRKIDEKIIAYGMLNSMLQKPTKIYTRDQGIKDLTLGSLQYLTSNLFTASNKVLHEWARKMVKHLESADLKVLLFNNNCFEALVDNINHIQKGSKWFDFAGKKNQKAKILKDTENRLKELYFKVDRIKKGTQPIRVAKQSQRDYELEKIIGTVLKAHTFDRDALLALDKDETKQSLDIYDAMIKLSDMTDKSIDPHVMMNLREGKEMLEAKMMSYSLLDLKNQKTSCLKRLNEITGKEKTSKKEEAEIDRLYSQFKEVSERTDQAVAKLERYSLLDAINGERKSRRAKPSARKTRQATENDPRVRQLADKIIEAGYDIKKQPEFVPNSLLIKITEYNSYGKLSSRLKTLEEKHGIERIKGKLGNPPSQVKISMDNIYLFVKKKPKT